MYAKIIWYCKYCKQTEYVNMYTAYIDICFMERKNVHSIQS